MVSCECINLEKVNYFTQVLVLQAREVLIPQLDCLLVLFIFPVITVMLPPIEVMD